MASKTLYKTKITSDDSTAQEQMGVLRREWDSTSSSFKTYRYVQVQGDTTVANGTPLGFSDALMDWVTSDVSDTNQNQPAGVGIGAITASQFGWIQVGGLHPNILSTAGGTTADGETIILGTADGSIGTVAVGTASTHRPIGVAVSAGAGTAMGYLTLCEIVQ